MFKDDNARRAYAPLREEPDLFVKFASLASRDPGTRDGRYEIMLDWIKEYGVLGLVVETPSHDTRSERQERLSRFWEDLRRDDEALRHGETGAAHPREPGALPPNRARTSSDPRSSAKP